MEAERPFRSSFFYLRPDWKKKGKGMGSFSKANIGKAWSYLKRNGLVKTYYAARERMEQNKEAYRFEPVSRERWEAQREWSLKQNLRFSIVVPLYKTPRVYLEDLLHSLENQSYPHWELILADATEDEGVKDILQELAGERISELPEERLPEPTEERMSKVPEEGAAGLAEAGMPKPLEAAPGPWKDGRILYLSLEENGGISRNTNCGLAWASGDYVGLLDHDDVLTEDALYEMAAAVEKGGAVRMLYSDEDKCNGDRTEYYEPHWKMDFNLDLLLTNNYICHFLVLERELIQRLGLREAYDGAQDYDLVLRAAGEILGLPGEAELSPVAEGRICHVPRVLYHWRCHRLSTAENPGSKEYAYEAGRRAVQDFLRERGIPARVDGMEHKGFYRVSYGKGPLDARKDLAAVGGKVLSGKPSLRKRLAGNSLPENESAGNRSQENRITGSPLRPGSMIGGPMTEEGELLYGTLPPGYSGYMHRAALQQDAAALDIRNLEVRRECRELFREVTGVPYRELPGKAVFDASALPEGTDYKALSLALSKAFRQAGYRLLYDPDRQLFWKEKEKQSKEK